METALEMYTNLVKACSLLAPFKCLHFCLTFKKVCMWLWCSTSTSVASLPVHRLIY